jgi:rhamnulokinase
MPQPVVTEEAMDHNFTNEGGFGGTTRFLKNVMELWLLQECWRTWARNGKDYSYEELRRLAESEPAFGPLVDPDHPAILAPGDMPWRIRRFCQETGQNTPEEPGEIVRCVLESLALKYRWVVEQVGQMTGRSVEVIHVVGGGSQDSLLCQLTADAARQPVLAGPVEATALENVMVQAFARGYVGSLEEMRTAVRRSVDVRTYEPRGHGNEWDGFYERFPKIIEAAPSLNGLEGG